MEKDRKKAGEWGKSEDEKVEKESGRKEVLKKERDRERDEERIEESV